MSCINSTKNRWEKITMIFTTWRIIPFSTWLTTMVSCCPLSKVVPHPNGQTLWPSKWGWSYPLTSPGITSSKPSNLLPTRGVPAFAWRVWLRVSTCSPWALKFNWFPARSPGKNNRKRNTPKTSQPIRVLQGKRVGGLVLVLLVLVLCFVPVVFVRQPKLEQKIMEVKPPQLGTFFNGLVWANIPS